MQNTRPAIERNQFKRDLETSNQAATVVAQWFIGRGVGARVNPMRIAPNHASRREYTDDGDISSPRGRIEVKHWPNIAFTGHTDCPYEWVFVDEVYQIDRPHTQPLWGYVIVNADMTVGAFIGAKTREHWRKRRHMDSRYGVELEWYACPKQYVEFRGLNGLR